MVFISNQPRQGCLHIHDIVKTCFQTRQDCLHIEIFISNHPGIIAVSWFIHTNWQEALSGFARWQVGWDTRYGQQVTFTLSPSQGCMVYGVCHSQYSHLADPWNQGIIAHQTPHFRRPPKHVNNKGPSVFAQTSFKCTFRTKSFNSIWKYTSFGRYV